MNEIPIYDHIAIYILTWDAQKWASAGVQLLRLTGGANHIMFGIKLKVIERAFT
jgi:hypothetical protein